MNEAVLQHSFPGARSISGPLRLFTEHPLFIHLPLSYLSLHCWPHTATLWRSKLNVERVEKGKGLFWEKGTFFVNLKGLWENPFSLSWVFEQWVIGKPHPHVPTHACQTHVHVCLHSNIQYGSMDTHTARQSYLNGTTGNERGDELFAAIATSYTEGLVETHKHGKNFGGWNELDAPPPAPLWLQQMCPCAKCWPPLLLQGGQACARVCVCGVNFPQNQTYYKSHLSLVVTNHKTFSICPSFLSPSLFPKTKEVSKNLLFFILCTRSGLSNQLIAMKLLTVKSVNYPGQWGHCFRKEMLN